jgi:uncharacterized membrane protein
MKWRNCPEFNFKLWRVVKTIIKHLRNYFITGLFVLLPLAITLELLIWGFNKADSILGGLFFKYLKLQIPGLGLLTLLILITLTGVSARNYIGKKLIEFGEQILQKIPILNGIYGTTKQITEGFAKSDKSVFRKVVLVEYPRKGIYSPGFLTGESPSGVIKKTGVQLLNVFVPTVPNPTTGFLIFVPEDQVIVLDLSVEDGFKLIISAGMIKPD